VVALLLGFAFECPALQMGQVNFSKATEKTTLLRDNVYLVEIHAPEDEFNLAVLSGPDGFLLVDHPEAASSPLVQKALGEIGKQPVHFLINTHWHYDHVGGNDFYGRDAVIIAHENVRKRLMTRQTPWWSPTPIGPYPESAWPRITFQDSLDVHFAGEDVELVHYGNGHTDGDSVVYFTHANIVHLGDLFHEKGHFSGGIDIEGLERALAAVVARTTDGTIFIAGHGRLSSRGDVAEYVQFLGDSLALVRAEIAAGKSEEEIKAAGLPEKWKSWPETSRAGIDGFLENVYKSLAHPDLNQ